MALLLLVTALGRLPFLYRGGVGDPDVIVMAAGLAHGLAPGVPASEWLLYGGNVSPAVPLLFRALYPLLGQGPGGTLGFLNAVGVLCGVLVAWPLYGLFRLRFDRGVSLGCSLLVMFSPAAWEAGLSFHPIVPALLLLLGAILAFLRGARPPGNPAATALAACALVAALALRSEVALALPALVLAAALGSGGRRRAASASLLALAGLVGFFAVLRLLPAQGSAGFGSYARAFLAAYFRLSGAAASGAWAVLALGCGTLLIALIGLARILRDDGPRPALVPLSVVVPVLAFWLPNQVFVARHFLMALPAIAWLGAEGVLARASRARQAALVGAALLLNLGAPEALYSAYNHAHPGSPKSPNGTFFSAHARSREQIGRYQALAREVMRATRGPRAPGEPPSRVLVVANWEAYGYLLYGMAQEPRPYRRLAVVDSIAGAPLYRYRVGDSRMDVLLANVARTPRGRVLLPPAQEMLGVLAAEPHGPGWRLYLPEELRGPSLAMPASLPPAVTY